MRDICCCASILYVFNFILNRFVIMQYFYFSYKCLVDEPNIDLSDPDVFLHICNIRMRKIYTFYMYADADADTFVLGSLF